MGLSAAERLASPSMRLGYVLSPKKRAQIYGIFLEDARDMPREQLEHEYADLSLLLLASSDREALQNENVALEKEIREKSRKKRAQIAARARHKGNYEFREKVVAAYQNGGIKEKNAAAERLSKEFDRPFSTIRRYLVGVSHAADRYCALRATYSAVFRAR